MLYQRYDHFRFNQYFQNLLELIFALNVTKAAENFLLCSLGISILLTLVVYVDRELYHIKLPIQGHGISHHLFRLSFMCFQ